MLGDFLARLAVALPLVSALAVLSLVAAKRGWFRLPGWINVLSRPPAPAPAAPEPALQLLSVKAVSPAARLAVVRFGGAEHLVGVSGGAMVLLASAPGAAPAPTPEQG
jgi:hypothetical protein